MAIPPFNNTRLNPHEGLDKGKQEELFDAITRNLEDIYNRFATTKNVSEATSRREVCGSVSAAGAIVGGSGFTVTHPGTGIYQITLKEELKSNGVIVGNAVNISSVFSPENAVAKSVFVVLLLSSPSGGFANGAFNFIIRQM